MGFHEGKQNLPGPPQNLKVTAVDETSVIVTFNEPAKNPDKVDVYRVFWRPVGAKGSNKSDIIEPKITLHDLESNVSYEVVAKAGNEDGTSQLTEPVIFQIAKKLNVQQAALQSGGLNSQETIIVILILIIVASSVIFILYKKNLLECIVKKSHKPLMFENPLSKPDGPSLAFENPFYDVDVQNPRIVPTEEMVQVNAEAEYSSYLSSRWQVESPTIPSSSTTSSSESSSGTSTPRGQGDTEMRSLSLADKMANIKTDMSHGKEKAETLPPSDGHRMPWSIQGYLTLLDTAVEFLSNPTMAFVDYGE